MAHQTAPGQIAEPRSFGEFQSLQLHDVTEFTRAVEMIDPKDPLKDGLTPPDYDEYGDAPDSGENAESEKEPESDVEPNPGESPLG